MINVFKPGVPVDPETKILRLGDIKSTLGDFEDSTSIKQMSGYVSVSTPDLVNDIIEPAAWNKHLWRYLNNPVYCFMHDHLQPIGHVKNSYTDANGLYLEGITLSDIPLVRDMLWPMIKDGSLKQQSVGFRSLAGEYVSNAKFYKHTECYLLESSLVTVACNPDAMLDQIKKISKFIPDYENIYGNNVNKFMADYSAGKLPSLSEVRKEFYMSIPNESPTVEETKTSQVASPLYEACEPSVELDSEAVSNDDTHLIKRVNGKRLDYALRIGTQHKSGVDIVFEDLAIATYKLLGARTDFVFAAGEREKAIKRVASLYRQLEKSVPTHNGVDIDKLVTPGLYDVVKYDTVTFSENEPFIYEQKTFENQMNAAFNILNSWKKSDAVTKDTIDMLLKYVYAVFEVYVSIGDREDADMVNAIIDAMMTAAEAAEAADEADEPTSIYEMNTESEIEKSEEVAKTPAEPTVDKELVELMKKFAKKR